jgi:hypothetical protein
MNGFELGPHRELISQLSEVALGVPGGIVCIASYASIFVYLHGEIAIALVVLPRRGLGRGRQTLDDIVLARPQVEKIICSAAIHIGVLLIKRRKFYFF